MGVIGSGLYRPQPTRDRMALKNLPRGVSWMFARGRLNSGVGRIQRGTESGGYVRNIFLSYSHKDKVFVDRLATDLEGSGAKIWLDRREIKPGDSIVDLVHDQLRRRCLPLGGAVAGLRCLPFCPTGTERGLN